MDFDNAKENIQPLASGRNVSLLQASLCQDATQELSAQRKQLELDIKNYSGDDPLQPWYAYICWIEQSYPAGGSNSGLQKVMHKCLARFEQDERYKQDPRLIKLFIKFMGNQGDKIECYQEMYNSGIGTMLADFYIAWAYSYDLGGNMRKANEIFRLGIDCRAQPLEELKEAHQHFGYTVAQRMMYTEGEETTAVTQELNDRRLALRSLHGQKRQNTITVGSIRTGAAVKSNLPGVVQSDGPSTSRAGRNANRQLEVFNDENADVNMPPPPPPIAGETEASGDVKSSLRSIIDSARQQENLKEPIAWSKPHKHGKIFAATAAHDPAFPIHVDEKQLPPITDYERHFDKPFKYPANFVAKSVPQKPWVTPVTIEDEPDKNALPCYNKCMTYPRPNMEFSPEECLAYGWFKRRQDQHPFVLRNNEWWSNGAAYGVRRYPNFATVAKPQPSDEMDGYRKLPEVQSLKTLMAKIYNDEEQLEYQLEEILAAKWREKRNEKHGEMDMEETVLMPVEKLPRRKSFFPSMQPGTSRKSVMPNMSNVMEEDEEKEEEQAAAEPSAIKIWVDPATEPTTSAAAVSSIPAPTATATGTALGKAPPVEDRFVVPAPPLTRFEIHEDEALPVPAFGRTAPSAFFDADETCSTQTFNIFIKSQAVSTPKALQKQAPVRQFGTLLKDTTAESPAPAPTPTLAETESNEAENLPSAQTVSPMLRKQLSTILETSEHGTHGSSGGNHANTKSTLISATTSPVDADTLQAGDSTTPATTKQVMHTPGPTRLQRQMVTDLSVLGEEPPAGNFERLQLWEANAPSVPLMKSLRFQEDKTETVTRPLMTCYQEDRTETLPKMPLALPEISLHQRTPNASKVLQAPLPPDDDEELNSLFTKTPAKPKSLGSPMFAGTTKRLCNQQTPEMFSKSTKQTNQSLDMFDDVNYDVKATKSSSKPATSMSKLTDSFMADLSFVPETQPPAAPKKFEIFLDESMPATAVPPMLDCTLPETQPQLTIGPAHLTASFMKDCTELSSCPLQLPVATQSPKSKFEIFLDDTMPPPLPATVVVSDKGADKLETIGPAHLTASFMKDCTKLGNPSPSMKLTFLSKSQDKVKDANRASTEPSTGSDYFELNAATEMFASNLSMIKNSTLLPEASKRSESPKEVMKLEQPQIVIHKAEDDDRSIYYKTTPLTPKMSHSSWQESSVCTPPKQNYEHRKVSIDDSMLNQTLAQKDVNPFNVDIINSLLDSIEFSLYIEKQPTCQLQGHVKRLLPQSTLEIQGEKFDVLKIIGKGAYGSVFSGVHKNSGKKVALKQEKPTNYWEYYICLEVHSRLANEEMIPAFMSIDYALVGNNSSIYVSELSEYGSLINVCNKFKKHVNKNMDEYVVMHLCCQLLDIVDHLHAMGIIHADIKADNFLLMKPLSPQSKVISLQLIDFGVSIDTKLFPPKQTFDYVYTDDAFKCIEMRTQRRWTYQLDLFGLAGVMHVLLFGRYMEVAQRQPGGIWMPKQAFPRYFNRQTWDAVFRGLLNVRDCQSMPNLQDLKTLFKSDLADKEKYVEAAIAKFNIVMQRQR
ncbi:uncharacterized protein LOC117785203 [Drosophila innubila]|uniref:uncharacterized protein LOC117785203 n=1 Tax=Drosophila innubila TaxID=198719 RepID=UPI00148B6D31|nr:uncharacterized protein LOC117785203 [Drosophila innubila]